MTRHLRNAFLGAVVLALSACRAGPATPAPISAPLGSPPIQTLRFTGGEAAVRVTGALRATFDAPLAPSSIYPSPPAELVLSWGTPGSGDGLDLQAPPVMGAAVTSDQVVLVLTVTVGDRTVEASSLDGECSVGLAAVRPGNVRGSFACRDLASLTGGVHVVAMGTFTATGCAPRVACRRASGSQ